MTSIREKRIQGVSFDLDGCLYESQKMRWRFLLQNLGGMAVVKATQQVRAEMRAQEFADGEAFFTEQCLRVSERLERSVDDVRMQIDSLFNERLCRVLKKIGPFDETREALQMLVAYGLKIAVVSDFSPDEKLAALGLLDLPWAAKIAADCSGALKPNARALLLAAEKMALSPEECLHVGDRIDTDVMGAQNAGFSAILIDSKQKGYASLKDMPKFGSLWVANSPMDAARCIVKDFAGSNRAAP